MSKRKPKKALPFLTVRIGEDYADSFAACRELQAAMFDLRETFPGKHDRYLMEVSLRDFGPIKLGVAEAPNAQWTMVRDADVIARAPADHFHVQFYRTRSHVVIIDGVERRLEPGDICIFDLSLPVTVIADGIDNLSAIVERSLLAPLLADRDEVHGLIVRRGSEAGVAVREHLEDMWSEGTRLSVRQGNDLSRSTAALLADVIRANGQKRAATGGELRKSQLRAICRRIDRQIADPGLGPDMLIRDFHVTRPTLYRMFEAHGGIGRYILGRRLAGVYRDLAHGSLANGTIDSILRQWGFTSHTAAGRVFRDAYGLTPSALRSQARSRAADRLPVGANAFDIPSEIPARVAAFRRKAARG
jgi:AraC-like DNA-binding protein